MQKENYIQSSNSEKLFTRSIVQDNAVGAIVIVHGVGEHLGRYPYLEHWLIGERYNCFFYDHRGHGRSEGIRGDVLSFHDYADDLNVVYDLVKTQNRALPIYVFGHSMGSLVVLLNLILYPGKWDGVILTGVPLKIASPIPKWQEVLGRFFVKFIPTLNIPSEIDPTFLSHDKAVIEAYNTDQLVQHKITLRWGIAFIAAVKEVTERLGEITENLLIMHGEEDKISGIEGACLLADKVGRKQAQLISFPGLYHELHNELKPDRNKVFQSIKSWLAKQKSSAQ